MTHKNNVKTGKSIENFILCSCVSCMNSLVIKIDLISIFNIHDPGFFPGRAGKIKINVG